MTKPATAMNTERQDTGMLKFLFMISAAGLLATSRMGHAQSPNSGQMQTDQWELPTGTLYVRIMPWVQTGNDEVVDLLMQHRLESAPGEKVLERKHVVRQSAFDHTWHVARDLRPKRGRKRFSMLLGCSFQGEGRYARFMDVYGPLDILQNDNGAMRQRLRRLVDETCGQTPSNNLGEPMIDVAGETNIPVPTTGQISLPQAPRGFKEFQGVVYFGIQPGGMFGPTSKTIGLFDDGTYTDDIATAFNEGIAVSKRENPKYWGQWRQRGKDLELKDHNDDAYEDTSGDWQTEPGRRDQTLDGCYGNIASSDGLGVGTILVGRATTWCFSPNGRFTHDATTFGTGANDSDVRGAASSSASLRGRYRIDHYAIHLVYDDGSDVTAGFAYLSDDHSHIAINGRRVMGSNKKD